MPPGHGFSSFSPSEPGVLAALFGQLLWGVVVSMVPQAELQVTAALGPGFLVEVLGGENSPSSVPRAISLPLW